jgi:sugar lactone lactonase YvrE
MKTHLFLTAIGSAVLAATLPVVAQGKLKIAWELTEGVKAPESAYYDAKTGHLYISQIGEGGGKAKDRDGWISKLKLDGSVVKERWFSGLHAPKGMRSHQGILWVSDIDRLVGIDMASSNTHRIFNIAGAKFLNDVAAGPTGIIYVSDMPASTIYQKRGDRISKLAAGQQLDSPNGLLVSGNTLFIAGWGKNLTDSFEVSTPGRLLSYNLRTRKLKAITRVPTGNLDGLELDGRGGFFVTDWSAGSLFHITAKGAVTSILNLPKGTADLCYIPEKKLLILPRMLENRVTAYDLSEFKP